PFPRSCRRSPFHSIVVLPNEAIFPSNPHKLQPLVLLRSKLHQAVKMGCQSTRPSSTRREWCAGLPMFRIAHSLTLAFERAAFGGLEGKLAEGPRKGNRDWRLCPGGL